MPTPADKPHTMDTTRRGNYESGADYVLEYGQLRFTFNERDFVSASSRPGCGSGS